MQKEEKEEEFCKRLQLDIVTYACMGEYIYIYTRLICANKSMECAVCIVGIPDSIVSHHAKVKNLKK